MQQKQSQHLLGPQKQLQQPLHRLCLLLLPLLQPPNNVANAPLRCQGQQPPCRKCSGEACLQDSASSVAIDRLCQYGSSEARGHPF